MLSYVMWEELKGNTVPIVCDGGGWELAGQDSSTRGTSPIYSLVGLSWQPSTPMKPTQQPTPTTASTPATSVGRVVGVYSEAS